MSTRIDELIGTWKDGGPANTTNLGYEQVGLEHRVHWGEATGAGTSYNAFGFTGSAPPIRVLEIGERVRLGRIKHYHNNAVAGVSENLLQTVTLQLDFTFAGPTSSGSIDLDFVLTSGDSESYLSLSGGFPQTLAVGDYIFELLAFQGSDFTLANRFTFANLSTTTVWLYAEVVSDALDDIECTDDNRVFTSTRCEIACVVPVEDLPVISDCYVPPSPMPIVDCPDIDLPAVSAMAVGRAAAGTPGDPGENGINGCTPELTFEVATVCVDTTPEIEVTLVITPYYGDCCPEFAVPAVDPCNYLLSFTFYIYCPPDDVYYGSTSGCCWWVWCQCECEDPASVPSVDEDCPKSDTCSEVTMTEGRWILLDEKSDDSCDPEVNQPCTTGTFYSQVQITCDCPEQEECVSCGLCATDLPETCTVSFADVTGLVPSLCAICDSMEGPHVLNLTGDCIYTGDLAPCFTLKVEIFQFGGTGGVWMFVSVIPVDYSVSVVAAFSVVIGAEPPPAATCEGTHDLVLDYTDPSASIDCDWTLATAQVII